MSGSILFESSLKSSFYIDDFLIPDNEAVVQVSLPRVLDVFSQFEQKYVAILS